MRDLHGILKMGQAVMPSILVSPEDYQKHLRLASYLSSELAFQVGFEVRLDRTQATSGMALYANPDAGVWQAFFDTLHDDLRKEHAWQTLQRLYNAFQQPDSVLYRASAGVWLEFDTVRRGFLIPDIFFGLNADGFQEITARIVATMELIQGQTVESDIQVGIGKMIAAVPPGAKVQQMGAMLARHLPGVRLVMGFPALEPVLAYLEHIQWMGDLNTVKAEMTWLADYTDSLILSLDVSAGLFPRIGIEPQIKESPHPQFEPRWQHFLFGFSRRGYCSCEKRDALLNFSGWQIMKESDSVLRHGLSHFKLVFQPQTPTYVKAYFGFRLRSTAKKELKHDHSASE